MGGEGLEPVAAIAENGAVGASHSGDFGANAPESAAPVAADYLNDSGATGEPMLSGITRVVEAWPTLSPAARIAIITIVSGHNR